MNEAIKLQALEISETLQKWVDQGIKLNDIQNGYIKAAIESKQNNAEAARMLGISRSTLYDKISQIDLKIKKYNELDQTSSEIKSPEAARVSLANLVRKARLKSGLKLEYIASLLGYQSASTISEIESGKRSVPTHKVEEFSTILEIPLDVLEQAVKMRAITHPRKARIRD